MENRKRLGVNSEVYCLPLFRGLNEQAEFETLVDVVAANAIKMREHDLEAAFLSPVDYARESSDYLIVPDVAVSSKNPTKTIMLHFKEGLHSISRIAVSPTSTSEIVLASILLGERYDVRPQIVPVMGSVDKMLASADAALVVGNAALDLTPDVRNTLDLVEEWNDLTDLPYIHGFWCIREAAMSKTDVEKIRLARDRGADSLDAVVDAEIGKHPHQSPHSLKQYLEGFSYSFTEEEQDGVLEFLRYAYYHAILPDVADLNFYRMDEEDEPPLTSPLLN